MQLKEVIPHQPDIRTYMEGTYIPNSCLVGVEVELEQFRGNGSNLTYWKMEHDGSLRDGGVEFVLRQPLTGIDLEKAIDELNTSVITDGKYNSNHRCSTHVHIDVRDLSIEHLQKIVFIYSMFERFIYDMVEPTREHNFYCAPLYSSLQNRRAIATSFEHKDFSVCPKYSGLNLRTVYKYGSLEFRMHEGMKQGKDIKKWIMLLMKLRSGTAVYENVSMRELLKLYSENSAQAILQQVLGADVMEDMVASNDRMRQSMRAAQDMLLLAKGGTLRHKEMQWRRIGGKKGDIPGIDPEVLEILRARRDEILGQ